MKLLFCLSRFSGTSTTNFVFEQKGPEEHNPQGESAETLVEIKAGPMAQEDANLDAKREEGQAYLKKRDAMLAKNAELARNQELANLLAAGTETEDPAPVEQKDSTFVADETQERDSRTGIVEIIRELVLAELKGKFGDKKAQKVFDEHFSYLIRRLEQKKDAKSLARISKEYQDWTGKDDLKVKVNERRVISSVENLSNDRRRALVYKGENWEKAVSSLAKAASTYLRNGDIQENLYSFYDIPQELPSEFEEGFVAMIDVDGALVIRDTEGNAWQKYDYKAPEKEAEDDSVDEIELPVKSEVIQSKATQQEPDWERIPMGKGTPVNVIGNISIFDSSGNVCGTRYSLGRTELTRGEDGPVINEYKRVDVYATGESIVKARNGAFLLPVEFRSDDKQMSRAGFVVLEDTQLYADLKAKHDQDMLAKAATEKVYSVSLGNAVPLEDLPPPTTGRTDAPTTTVPGKQNPVEGAQGNI